MSAHVGDVTAQNGWTVGVFASRGGVELDNVPSPLSLDPIEARGFAALIVQASKEV